MSTDSTRLLPIVSSIWLIRHIVEFWETKMPWAVQKPAEERKSWLCDYEWQVCEVLYESWEGTTWIRHRCAIQRTCANRSGNTKPATEMEKKKHRVNVMCSASGTLGAWIQDAKTPNTATEEDTDNKTQGCWGGILSQEIKTCLYRQTEPLNNAKWIQLD